MRLLGESGSGRCSVINSGDSKRDAAGKNEDEGAFSEKGREVPEQGAETRRGIGGQSSRVSPLGADLGRQQAGTGRWIDQLKGDTDAEYYSIDRKVCNTFISISHTENLA